MPVHQPFQDVATAPAKYPGEKGLVMISNRHRVARDHHLLPLALAFMSIALGFILYTSTGHDDPYITYGAARILARHGEILNYNGDRIEQSSSMLYVILLASLHLITGIRIELIGPLLSIFAGASSVLSTYWLAKKIDPKSIFGATLLLATSAYLVYWSFSGAEVTLTSLALVIFILACGDYLTTAEPAALSKIGVITGVTVMLSLVRPEASAVIACVLLGMFVLILFKQFQCRPGSRADKSIKMSNFGIMSLIACVTTVALISFRLTYFGSAFPNPVSVKMSGGVAQSTQLGIKYLKDNLLLPGHSPLFTIAAVAVVISVAIGIGLSVKDFLCAESVNPYALLSMLFIVAYISFIVISGGDWMVAGRFIAPILPLCMIFAAITLVRTADPGWRQRAMLASLVLCQLLVNCYCAQYKSSGMPIWEAGRSQPASIYQDLANDWSWFETTNRIHMRDVVPSYVFKQVVEDVQNHVGRKVVIMSGQMGLMPYKLLDDLYGQVYMIDTHGLISDDLAQCPAMTGLTSLSFGIINGYQTYFKNLDEVNDQCSIPSPDVILELGKGYAGFVEEHGYRVVFKQVGAVDLGGRLFHGLPADAMEFIAVREDLLPALRSDLPYYYSFPKLM